ncbi:major facilitator superfamily domain-containing protein [Xylariaceae sp. FL1272]|nr:major facilitator superfamily domain-containing protein [Xylariaceae sp. FL1272]
MTNMTITPSPRSTVLETEKPGAATPRTQSTSQDLEASSASSLDESQKWNYPKSNIGKVAACFWSFIVIGTNAAAYGALIPYIQTDYNLTYTLVSLIFLSPVVGHTVSALLNNWVHELWGQRGVALISSGCHVVAYAIMAVHPPYPLLVIAFLISGFGDAVGNAGWHVFIGNLDNATQLLGFLNGFFGIGGVIAPLIATSFIVTAGQRWNTFYYFMLGLAVLELVSTVACFWSSTGSAYRAAIVSDGLGNESKNATLKEALISRPSARLTWLCSLFLVGYAGIEVALGGWIVDFMIHVRHGSEFASGITATGFWLGITVGRFVLCFVTPKIGDSLASTIYLVLIIGLELTFWLVPHFIISAVTIGFQGFFLGPLFPAVVVVMSKLLPRRLHVSALGFATAFGSGGATVLPFAIGAIAQVKGVQVLPPIIFAFLVAILLLWLGVPRVPRGKKG